MLGEFLVYLIHAKTEHIHKSKKGKVRPHVAGSFLIAHIESLSKEILDTIDQELAKNEARKTKWSAARETNIEQLKTEVSMYHDRARKKSLHLPYGTKDSMLESCCKEKTFKSLLPTRSFWIAKETRKIVRFLTITFSAGSRWSTKRMLRG